LLLLVLLLLQCCGRRGNGGYPRHGALALHLLGQ